MILTPWPGVCPCDADGSSVEWKEHRCFWSRELGFIFQLCCFLPNILGNVPHFSETQFLHL